MIGLNQVAQVAVDKRRLVHVLHNRKPTEPESIKGKSLEVIKCHHFEDIPNEFKIEPRYAQKKKLRQIREKSYGGPKLIDENNFTIKKHKKTRKFSNFNAL